MKTLLLSLFSLTLSTASFGQNYESLFGSTSTQWNMSAKNLGFSGTDRHSITGDTIINSLSYKIVDGYSAGEYQGFIREDIARGKAWYRSSKDTSEILMMDLSLAMGDSMFVGGNWNPNPNYYHVDSVFTFEGRKHIRFDLALDHLEGKKFTVIEGVSSNLGFRYQDNYYPGNFGPELLCHYKNGQRVYGEGSCEVQSITDLDKDAGLSVFPNPFSNKLSLRLNTARTVRELQLFNEVGKQILREDIYGDNLILTGLSDLPPGVYFVIALDKRGNQITSEKLIKTGN